jgi:hypothetical protein
MKYVEIIVGLRDRVNKGEQWRGWHENHVKENLWTPSFLSFVDECVTCPVMFFFGWGGHISA